MEEEIITMSGKGQVVIPARVRRNFGLRKGDKLRLEIGDKKGKNKLIKNLGSENKQKILDLTSTNLVFINVTHKIAMQAGDLRLKYNIPTIDSIITATCIVENIKHILTND